MFYICFDYKMYLNACFYVCVEQTPVDADDFTSSKRDCSSSEGEHLKRSFLRWNTLAK